MLSVVPMPKLINAYPFSTYALYGSTPWDGTKPLHYLTWRDAEGDLFLGDRYRLITLNNLYQSKTPASRREARAAERYARHGSETRDQLQPAGGR